MKLIDEIMRCAPVFDAIDEASLSSLSSLQLRALIQRKNGALALSGALVLFGCGGDQNAPMHISRFKKWPARNDYGLQSNDEIFGADIFGDLLFVRSGTAFRLDGETGEHVSMGDLDAVLNQGLEHIAEELGGHLGRVHFAERAIGRDPLRLLPTYPFMMRQHVRGEFFEAPLSHTITLKHRLLVACRGAPDGADIDCSFWKGQ